MMRPNNEKRINLLYMIMALVTIVASVSIACTVFYNVLKHEVLEDMHNYIDVFIGADAWGMVTDPDNIVEQKVIDNYDGNLRITFINSQGYAIVDTLVDIDKMEIITNVLRLLRLDGMVMDVI